MRASLSLWLRPARRAYNNEPVGAMVQRLTPFVCRTHRIHRLCPRINVGVTFGRQRLAPSPADTVSLIISQWWQTAVHRLLRTEPFGSHLGIEVGVVLNDAEWPR